MRGTRRSEAEEWVWARMPDGTRTALAALPRTDLQTLLLSLARDRAATVTPAEVMRRWRDDRFVRPADVDPRRLAVVEARIWQLLPLWVHVVELSPVVPLGSCSAVAPVDRAAHFRLFTLVSSARDTGSGTTQALLLTMHLAFWQRVLADLAPHADPRLHLTVIDNPVIRERLDDTVLPGLTSPAAAVPVVDEPGRVRGRGYYTDAALRITARITSRNGAAEVELGDGGFTTWTGKLMNNAKERCLISCLGAEALSDLADI